MEYHYILKKQKNQLVKNKYVSLQNLLLLIISEHELRQS